MNAAGTLVLLYHRVAHLDRDPHGLAVRPDRFAQHCEILRQRCDVVPLRKATGGRRQVAITFDDGYADNAVEARRVLTDAGLCATFFITVGRLGEHREAWWDRLEQIVLERAVTAEHIEIVVGGRPLWADLRSPAARERAHLALFWRLRSMQPAAIDATLDRLESLLGVRSVDREAYRWMTANELRALAASDGIEIGAHTLTHPFLPSLQPQEQWREIAGSRELLQELLATPTHVFSHPYGGPDALSPATTDLVRKAGFTLACTTLGGLAPSDCDPLQIPRNVVGDWEADRFEQWLEHWIAAP